MQPVRLGVIGCGVIGNVHLAAATASPLIEVVAIADLRPEASGPAAEKFGIERVYGEGAELLADPAVEAVILAMPACHRLRLALLAFAAGKHVLTEKPVAMNAGDVRRMIQARGELTSGCCSCRYRFTESARAATDFIAGGALGDLRVVRCRAVVRAVEPPATTPPDWRLTRALNGGGILMNWGCYDLDYLLGVTGWRLRPRTVLAQCWTVPAAFEPWIAPGSDAETHFAALVLCEGGTAITFERAEYCPAEPHGAWELIGEKGSLVLHMPTGKGKRLVFHEATTDRGTVEHVVWEGDDSGGVTSSGPVEDFAAAIREGRPPMTSLEQALVVQQISDAIYASARSGGAVEVA